MGELEPRRGARVDTLEPEKPATPLRGVRLVDYEACGTQGLIPPDLDLPLVPKLPQEPK